METLSSVSKRKKRKTRKCLDEIRKRSRRNATNDKSLGTSPILKVGSKPANSNGIKPNNICITSNRLTLAMFPKVIRSETITRPVLSEISEDPGMNFENIIKNTKSINNVPPNGHKLVEPSQSDSDYIKYSEDKSISSTCELFSPAEQTSIQKDSDSGNLTTQDNNSPGSFLMFSPVDRREDSDLFEVSLETLSTTSTSSQSTQEGVGYQLYEEFMSEISMHLKQNAPALLKDDPIKRTKSQLHEMYLDSCRRESEENILHSMRKRLVKIKSCTPKETPAQSPVMEYQLLNMKRSRGETDKSEENILHSMKQRLVKIKNCTPKETPSESPVMDYQLINVKRPRGENDQVIYGKPSHHSLYETERRPLYSELNCQITYDKPEHQNIYDKPLLHSTCETPDYTYYPHKLNQ